MKAIVLLLLIFAILIIASIDSKKDVYTENVKKYEEKLSSTGRKL